MKRFLIFVVMFSSVHLACHNLELKNEVFQDSFKTGIATGMIPGLGQLIAMQGISVDFFASPLIDFVAKWFKKERRDAYEFLFQNALFWESLVIGYFLIRHNYEKILGARPAKDDDYFNPFVYSSIASGLIYYIVPRLTSSLIDGFTSHLKKRNIIAQGLLLGHLAGIAIFILPVVIAAKIDKSASMAVMAGLSIGAGMYLYNQRSASKVQGEDEM